MPNEGQSKPNEQSEPDPSPDSEKTPSDHPSPEEEQKSKAESGKSVPESPADQPSPDDPSAPVGNVRAPEGGEPADDNGSIPTAPPGKELPISGLDVAPAYHRYYYDSLSSDDEETSPDEDDDDDDYESWIECYSAESDPHWIAIRDACELVMDNARKAVANYAWHSKRSGCEFDTKRLKRLASQLANLGDDLEELAATTAPTRSTSTEMDTLLKLIRCLSEMGSESMVREAVRGNIDCTMLASCYKGYKSCRKEMLKNATASKLKACQCLAVWEKYRGAFIGYYRETKVLESLQGAWAEVRMSETDLKTWNKEMRSMARVAERLLTNLEGIVVPLMDQLGFYLKFKKDLKREFSDLLGIEVPCTSTQKIQVL